MRHTIDVIISGIPYTFRSDDSSISATYTIIKNSIISIGPISSQIDIRQPIATTGGSTIVFPRRLYDGTSIETLLGGVLPPPSTSARLLATLTSSATTAQIAGVSTGSYYHIGTECIYISSSSGNTRTITRGARGTIKQAHYVNPELGQYPYVMTYPFAWVSRYMYIVLDGTQVWMRGYITGIPTFSDDCVTIPWAPLDSRVSDTPPNALTSVRANLYIEHYVSVPLRIPMITEIDSPISIGTLSGTTYTVTWGTDWTRYVAVDPIYSQELLSSPSAPTMTDSLGKVARILSWSATGTAGTYTVSLSQTLTNGQVSISGGGRICYTQQIQGTGVGGITYLTLQTALTTYNDNRPQVPASIEQLDPTLCMVYYRYTRCLTSKAKASTNQVSSSAVFYGIVWWETTTDDPEWQGDLLGLISRDEYITSCKYRYSSSDRTLAVTGSGLNLSTEPAKRRNGMWNGVATYPIRVVGEGYDISCVYSGGIRAHATFFAAQQEWTGTYYQPLTSVVMAERWWEFGEKYLCLDQLISYSGDAFRVKATWQEPTSDETFETTLTLKYIAPFNSGYRYEVVEPPEKNVAGIGSWCGYEAVFERSAETITEPPGYGMLDLLISIDGQAGDIYPTVSAGLGMPLAYIDDMSFILNDAPITAIDGCIMNITEKTVSEAMQPYLLMSCTGIAMGRDSSGNHILKRISLAAPNLQDIVLSISDDDIIGLPTSDLSQNVATVYHIITPDKEINATDVDACQIYGQGETIEIDLSTAHFREGIDIKDELQSVLAKMVEVYGKPQRRWRMTIPFPKGKDLCIGDCITVTSKYLYGTTPQRGVTNQAGRIVGVTQDIMGDTTTIDVICAWKNSSGYAPCFYAYLTSSSSSVQIPLHEFTAQNSPLRDSDYLRVGATVMMYTDEFTYQNYVITNITQGTTYDTITFNTAITLKYRPLYFVQTTTYSTPPVTTGQFIMEDCYMV